jgi:DNA modification methylase
MLNSSKRGEAVLDPFGGSGSTLIACEKTGRKARLIEVDPHFCDVIVSRWQDFTGGAAILENEERSFAEVAEERLSGSPADVEL